MNYEQAKNYLRTIGQSGLLEYYDELDEEKRRILLDDISETDFSVVENIRNERKGEAGEILPVTAVKGDGENSDKYYAEGLKLLRANKVGAVLLAGGQGSRLGFDKPKGMFDIGETRPIPIFAQLIENVKKVTDLSGVCFPLFVMTSEKNNAETVAFFRENNYFGYPKDRVFFYVQKTQPACDFQGKVFLEEKHLISRSPNGNGGWYTSLVESDCGSVLKAEGIEWLNVFSVDNVLQKICDPLFIGATSLSGCACGAKAVKKTCPEEKVGVLCNRGGKPFIIEYYDIPEELAALRGEDGELVFRYGVILNYLFSVEKLERIASDKLPYHLAKKAIPHMEGGERVVPDKPNGYKFETLVVDMVGLMGSCLVYEVEREREFAPVKNKTGVDSVESARALMKKNGISI